MQVGSIRVRQEFLGGYAMIFRPEILLFVIDNRIDADPDKTVGVGADMGLHLAEMFGDILQGFLLRVPGVDDREAVGADVPGDRRVLRQECTTIHAPERLGTVSAIRRLYVWRGDGVGRTPHI